MTNSVGSWSAASVHLFWPKLLAAADRDPVLLFVTETGFTNSWNFGLIELCQIARFESNNRETKELNYFLRNFGNALRGFPDLLRQYEG